MDMGEQGHAPCKSSNSKNPQSHSSQLLWASTSQRVGGGRHLPTIERNVQPRVLECASLACSMTGGLMSALGCGI